MALAARIVGGCAMAYLCSASARAMPEIYGAPYTKCEREHRCSMPMTPAANGAMGDEQRVKADVHNWVQAQREACAGEEEESEPAMQPEEVPAEQGNGNAAVVHESTEDEEEVTQVSLASQ